MSNQWSPAAVLDAAKGAVFQGRLRTSKHARERAEARGVQAADLRAAVLSAQEAEHDPPENKWKLKGGTDVDGDPLVVVISFDGPDPRVVTMY